MNSQGKVIGTDGIKNGQIRVLKTTIEDFGNGVAGAGLSKKDLKAIIDFIMKNNGNSDVFGSNPIAYDNSVEIVGSQETRQAMYNEVSRDNGQGGMGADNNREYGGYLEGGKAINVAPGKVGVSGVNEYVNIDFPANKSTYHSHPSGGSEKQEYNPNSYNMGDSMNRGWTQHPSPQDLQIAGGNTSYVFGMDNGMVYIYNQVCVQAIIPMLYFVTPKMK